MDGEHPPAAQRKRRTACDQCNASKVKCPGGPAPCERCVANGLQCHYSFAARMGKPPGSRNKKTLERLQAAGALDATSRNRCADLHPPADLSSAADDTQAGNEATESASGDVSMMDGAIYPSTSSATLHDDPFSFTNDPALMPRARTQRSPGVIDLEHLTPSSLTRSLEFPPESLCAGDHNNPSANTPCVGSIDFNITDFHLPSPVAPPSLGIQDLGFGPGSNVRQGGLPPDRAPACMCFDEQARVLGHLRGIERRHRVMRVDVLLANAAAVADAVETRLRCRDCAGGDLQVLALVVMTLQLIFRWAKGLVHAPGEPCADVPRFQMGYYEVSVAEAPILKNILTVRAHEKLRRALIGTRSRIEIARAEATGKSPSQLWEFETGELRALETSIALLMQASDVLERKMKQQQHLAGAV